MENVTRKNSKRAAMSAAVRLDNSAAHFKNNKLSDNLSSTLDVLFRKKNVVRIQWRDQASETRRDYEYLIAVQEVAKHQKASRGISTSATARQRSAQINGSHVSVHEPVDKEKVVIRATRAGESHGHSIRLQQQQQQRHRFLEKTATDSAFTSRSSSPSNISDVISDVDLDTDHAQANQEHSQSGKLSCGPNSLSRGAIWQQKPTPLSSIQSDPNRQARRARRHESKVWAVNKSKTDRSAKSGGSHFRYTRGPSYNAAQKSGYVAPTCSSSMMQTVVYDPGDIFLTGRRRSVVSRSAMNRRSKTALGIASVDDVSGEELAPCNSRPCQSAGLSRRKLMEMNNIDALIESSVTPLFCDRNKIHLQNAKRDFQTIQIRVSKFLEDVDRFNKQSASKKHPTFFFLDL